MRARRKRPLRSSSRPEALNRESRWRRRRALLLWESSGIAVWPRILTSVTFLSDAEIDAKLAAGDWRLQGRAVVREWKFEDFASAIAFVNRVAEAAEAANHHPDILLHGWNKVRLELSTHSEGGLTQADFDMASRIDALA